MRSNILKTALEKKNNLMAGPYTHTPTQIFMVINKTTSVKKPSNENPKECLMNRKWEFC